MRLITFDEALTSICDFFDELISPRKIVRSNANIIYLMFKAVSKGYEVINNVCVTLHNKFDPANCQEEDLESVADLVGTRRYKGSGSGLKVFITNDGEEDALLLSGKYTYSFDEDTAFTFELLDDTLIQKGGMQSFIFMTEKIGSFPVTEQESIEVSADVEIPEGFSFSCIGNENLLGVPAETLLEFRKRILEDTERQNNIVELQTALRRLPYLFDCRVKYNNEFEDIVYDGLVIPPFTMAIFYAGNARNEIADIVASYILCPTVSTEDSVTVVYENEVMANGTYEVNIIPFKKMLYSVTVQYKLSSKYAEASSVEAEIRSALFRKFSSEAHEDYVKEDSIYNAISALSISGIELLGVDIIYNGQTVNYIDVPASRIPQISDISFIQE